MTAHEIRPDTHIADDIKKAAKALNTLIAEGKKDKLLLTEITLTKNVNIYCPEIIVKITKVF